MGRPFLILLAVAFSVLAPARSAEWVTRSWLSEDGLPQDSANALVQARDGFLWIGTTAGLARFDGNAQAAQRFLNNDPADVDEVRTILKDIAESDRRASEIIRRMRAMMKKGEAQMEPRDINADIGQVLVLLHSELAARNVTVTTQLLPGLRPVHGDRIQLQQVLLNLIVNGCDAMHDIPPDERRLLIATEHAADDMVHVSVMDRGAGIAPEVFEQIFNAFYSTKANGLGMGLSICRAIIKAHGGLLWAGNNPDRGATFHFTLRLGERK